jgi:hypothetical protein
VTYIWSREVASTPLSAIPKLGEELLLPEVPFECLQPVPAFETLSVVFPDDLLASIAAHPLPIHVNIDVNVEGTLDVYAEI